MLAVDTNILVYAHRRESRHGEQAYEVLRALAEGNRPWAIPWPCCYEFFSVVTNRRIWADHASSPQHAWHQLTAWAASPSNRMIGETDHFMEILDGFVNRLKLSARWSTMPGSQPSASPTASKHCSHATATS